MIVILHFQLFPSVTQKVGAFVGSPYRTYSKWEREIVSKTSEAIVQIILQDYQSPPEIEEQWKNITQEFGDLWQFPHVVKTIDGKHVSIEAPANSGFCIIIIKEHLELFFWLYAMPNILLH